MPKAPLAKEPEASKRKERRTVIASGPVPVPKAPSPPPADAKADEESAAAAKAKAKANIKKTQMIMGAPPLPPSITGKTQIPSGPPKIPKIPKIPAVPPAAKAKPPAPTIEPPLPSHEKTVVGPAPAPPIPTAVPASNSDVMSSMMEGTGLFSDDFDDEPVTKIHHSGPIRIDTPELKAEIEAKPAPPRRGKKDTQVDLPTRSAVPTKPPPRPQSGPAPRAKPGKRDTMTAAELRNEPTDPGSLGSPSAASGATLPSVPEPGPEPTTTQPTAKDLGIADTHIDTHGSEPEHRPELRPTDPQPAGQEGRPSRANTAMQGTDRLAAPPADAPKIRLTPGKIIPGTRYRIRKWLGEGGMGVVYEVAHADIERRSALKILRFDLSQQPQMAQVFRDEARAASRLGSPYIVEVYDFGELPDGRLYFAMDLLEGEDLVPADEQTCMDPSRLIAILRQVCKGLSKAHEANVVHRDVKPENIIICEIDGRADSVKIVDFGISAMLAAGEAKAGIAGTPHYMAPEQILGEDFDGRLDVYALGCTAYELMVGMPPFDAEEVEDVLKQQVGAAPKPPSEVRPELTFPPDLEAVIMRCLAKKPAERYPDMAHLEAALCEAQIAAKLTTAWDDLPVPVLPDQERYQSIVDRMPSPHAPQPAKRSLLWPIVAGLSTLAAASLAAYLAFGRQPTEEEVDQVEKLTIEARDAASKMSWVIPPPHFKGNETALRKVADLEDLEGNAESMADERGLELRHEFATTLISHGDGLWQEAKGTARQYYIWSLIFEHDDHASERADVDAIALADLRKSALAGDFGETQRMFAGLALMEVAEDDEKAAMSEAMESMDTKDMAPTVAAQFAAKADSMGVKVASPKRGSGARNSKKGSGSGSNPRPSSDETSAGSNGSGADPGSEDGDVVVEDDGGEAEDPAATAGRKKRRRQVDAGLGGKGVKANPARSKELTKQADAKRRQGLRNEAINLYSQALAANPRNGAAHLGLAQVHFDLAKYDKARKSALAAVKNSPRNGRAHKVLGDAYYKAYRYKEAESAYEEAKRLGQNVDRRLVDVRKKLGR